MQFRDKSGKQQGMNEATVRSAAPKKPATGTHTAEGAQKRYFFRSIIHGITTAVMVVAIALAVALVGVRLIGYDVYTVLSGSMEPTYHTGSVIYVKPCEAEEVQIGDPITFVLNEDLVVATHRVIDIDEENGAFYTKGDANEAPDASPVLFENLIGVPVFSIPKLGYLAAYVQEPPGTYVAVVVCALLLMLTFIPDLFAKDEEEEEEGAKKKAKKAKKAKGETPLQPEPAYEPQPELQPRPVYAVSESGAVAQARPARASRQVPPVEARQPMRNARVAHDQRYGQPVQTQQPVRQARRVPEADAQQRQAVAQQRAPRAATQQRASQAAGQQRVVSAAGQQRAASTAESNNPRLRLQAHQQQQAARAAREAQAASQGVQCPPDERQQSANPRQRRRSL